MSLTKCCTNGNIHHHPHTFNALFQHTMPHLLMQNHLSGVVDIQHRKRELVEIFTVFCSLAKVSLIIYTLFAEISLYLPSKTTTK